jgi:hypothetical protein
MLMVTSGWAADLPSDQVSWMAFSPGERNTAKVAKDTSTSPLVVSNRFAALDTSDSGLGPQAIAPQVPEQVLVPATVPSQTHTDSLVPLYHSRPHRGMLGRGTCAV